MSTGEENTFAFNVEGMESNITNLTSSNAQLKNLIELAQEVVQAKLIEHGIQGDTGRALLESYKNEVIASANAAIEGNEKVIAQNEQVKEMAAETASKNQAIAS